ncbi:cation:proton antiporter [Salinifilum aidingensis]
MAQLLFVLVGALLVTAFARSRDIAAPLLLVLVGLAVSYLPGGGDFHVDPELLLTVVLPPLLYSAALESSYLDFRSRIAPIVHHGLLQVVATAFVLGYAAYLLVPELPLSSAVVLGAVLAPPDAVTAAAIGRRLKLPRPVLTVLGGESLINDAAALTTYRMAIAAVAGNTPTLVQGLGAFALAAGVGVGVGLLLGALTHLARTRVPDVHVATLLGVLVPFVAYLLAEELGGSGVLAVVSAGLYVGHYRPRARAAGRLQESAVWSSINLLLESFVFAYIGLQLDSVVTEVLTSGRDPGRVLAVAFALLAATVAVRVAWMFTSSYLPGLSRLTRAPGSSGTWRRTVVLSWTGMRGVVTLAAAGAIPYETAAGEPFPDRELIQLIAFVVTVGTILAQGTTLPWLIRRLRVSDPDEEQRDDEAEIRARRHAADAALHRLETYTPEHLGVSPEEHRGIVDRVKALVEYRDLAASEQIGRTAQERDASHQRTMATLRRALIEVERSALADERDAGQLDDEVLRRVLHELDMEEAALDASWRTR